jgi:hypothetical protein
MIEYLASLSSAEAALAIGVGAAGYWFSRHVNYRLHRRRRLMSHLAPCRRCGARN